jgi:hypothetical protein
MKNGRNNDWAKWPMGKMDLGRSGKRANWEKGELGKGEVALGEMGTKLGEMGMGEMALGEMGINHSPIGLKKNLHAVKTPLGF